MRFMFAMAVLAAICGLVTGRMGFVVAGICIVVMMFVLKFLEWYAEPRPDEPLEYYPGPEDDPRWKHHFTED